MSDKAARLLAMSPHALVDAVSEAFTPHAGFKVGDVVSMDFRRSWLDVWSERLTTLRWRVPVMETRWFEVTSTAPGAMWPEVK